MTEFAYSIGIPVRLRDLDVIGHANNAVYATYLEQARVAYLRGVVGEAFETGGIVPANLEIDYRNAVGLDGVTVGVRVTDLGETSPEMDYRIGAAGTVAATAGSTVIAYDGDEPRPLPDAWRERIRAHEHALGN